jgi:hypothetical protein
MEPGRRGAVRGRQPPRRRRAAVGGRITHLDAPHRPLASDANAPASRRCVNHAPRRSTSRRPSGTSSRAPRRAPRRDPTPATTARRPRARRRRTGSGSGGRRRGRVRRLPPPRAGCRALESATRAVRDVAHETRTTQLVREPSTRMTRHDLRVPPRQCSTHVASRRTRSAANVARSGATLSSAAGRVGRLRKRGVCLL